MQLSPIFVNNIQAVYGKAGKAWLEQLDNHLEDLSKQWNFRFIRSLPDLTHHFVCLVALNKTEETVILKTAPASKQIIAEMHCLDCFKQAVPKIYAHEEQKNAFLMEYLQPGESLKTLVKAGQDDTATRIICQTILNLQAQQKIIYSFKHLSEFAADFSFLEGKVDNDLLSKAISLFDDLTSDRTHDVLLHGDLHHDNIISHHSSWKVIDPHGYIGDPAAEVGAMIRNPSDCFPNYLPLAKIIENRLNILAEELPFDRQKIKAWAYCMTMLSSAWNVQDFGKNAKVEIEIASIIDKVK